MVVRIDTYTLVNSDVCAIEEYHRISDAPSISFGMDLIFSLHLNNLRPYQIHMYIPTNLSEVYATSLATIFEFDHENPPHLTFLPLFESCDTENTGSVHVALPCVTGNH